jgi:EmrB/QacA subfamily drug resistance transporter
MLDRHRPLLIALTVAGAFFMENLDGTVIATALPQMARSFATSPINLSVGMTAYILALAVFIPISGWMADRFGSRSVFGTAIVVFTLTSLLCGASQGVWSFTAARVAQGLGGAMMVPVGRLVVLRSTEKQHLMRAMAYITWPGLAAPVIGPPVGGFITTYADWRWIFWLNLPLGVLALALVALLFRNERGQQRRPFDATGFVLSGIALPSLMYGLDLAARPQAEWGTAAAVLALALVLGALAVWHFRRASNPLIDLAALRVPTFAVTVWGGSLFRIAIGSIPFLVPLLLQVAFGLSAFASGTLILAMFAGNLGMKSVTTPILRRFGFRHVLIGNGLVVVATIAACALLTPATPTAVIAAVLFAGGLCRSMQFTCLATIQFADIPPAQMSSASSFASMLQQFTMGMGIAVGAVFLHLALLARGADHLALADFRLTFALVAVVALLAVVFSLGVDPAAGAEVSGHRPARSAAPTATR